MKRLIFLLVLGSFPCNQKATKPDARISRLERGYGMFTNFADGLWEGGR